MSTEPGGKHVWISNAAFTRMTGIKKVCVDCGQAQGSDTATPKCRKRTRP